MTPSDDCIIQGTEHRAGCRMLTYANSVWKGGQMHLKGSVSCTGPEGFSEGRGEGGVEEGRCVIKGQFCVNLPTMGFELKSSLNYTKDKG